MDLDREQLKILFEWCRDWLGRLQDAGLDDPRTRPGPINVYGMAVNLYVEARREWRQIRGWK